MKKLILLLALALTACAGNMTIDGGKPMRVSNFETWRDVTGEYMFSYTRDGQRFTQPKFKDVVFERTIFPCEPSNLCRETGLLCDEWRGK